jgi:hypothetical protein
VRDDVFSAPLQESCKKSKNPPLQKITLGKSRATQGKIIKKKVKISAMQLLEVFYNCSKLKKKIPHHLFKHAWKSCKERTKKKELALQNTEQKHAMDTQRDAQMRTQRSDIVLRI